MTISENKLISGLLNQCMTESPFGAVIIFPANQRSWTAFGCAKQEIVDGLQCSTVNFLPDDYSNYEDQEIVVKNGNTPKTYNPISFFTAFNERALSDFLLIDDAAIVVQSVHGPWWLKELLDANRSHTSKLIIASVYNLREQNPGVLMDDLLSRLHQVAIKPISPNDVRRPKNPRRSKPAPRRQPS